MQSVVYIVLGKKIPFGHIVFDSQEKAFEYLETKKRLHPRCKFDIDICQVF